jgi:hypothetical protein
VLHAADEHLLHRPVAVIGTTCGGRDFAAIPNVLGRTCSSATIYPPSSA